MLVENVSYLFKWNMKEKTSLSCAKKNETKKGGKLHWRKNYNLWQEAQSDIHLVAGLRSLFTLECVTVSK